MMARLLAGLSLAFVISSPHHHAQAQPSDDYPTTTLVDYVLACMTANGDTRDSLDRCSCSIDVIATLLPHDQYVTAETVMSMAQLPGERGAQFRSGEQSQAAIDRLRRAQAEAEVRCF